MVEAEKAVSTFNAPAANGGQVIAGTQGLFSVLEERGLVYNNADFGGGNGLAEFDTILSELDKQGAIEENMMFLDRATSLSIDNMLGCSELLRSGWYILRCI
jgi:hypothetical protein